MLTKLKIIVYFIKLEKKRIIFRNRCITKIFFTVLWIRARIFTVLWIRARIFTFRIAWWFFNEKAAKRNDLLSNCSDTFIYQLHFKLLNRFEETHKTLNRLLLLHKPFSCFKANRFLRQICRKIFSIHEICFKKGFDFIYDFLW